MSDYIQRRWGKPYNTTAGHSTRPSQHSAYCIYQPVRYWNPTWIINHTFKAKSMLQISAFFSFLGATAPPPQGARAFSFMRFLDHTQRRSTVDKTPLNEWSPQHAANTQHSQQTNIHAPGGIRTHDLSRRAATDLRLRPRGHWDRHCIHIKCFNHLTSNGHYMGRTAQLTSRCRILYIYSTNMRTEYFKHAA